MPIVSAVGSAAGSSVVSGWGTIKQAFTVTPERAAFVQEEFRSVTWESVEIKTLYGKVARDTKDDPIITYFDNEADCYLIAQERGQILGSHARRFKVTVNAILTEADLGFALALPGAHLIDDELVADLDVAVASIETVDFNTGQTTLMVWGRVGSVPVSDDRILNSPARAAGTSTALAVGVAIKPVVGAASGSSSASVTDASTVAAGSGAASGAGAANGIALVLGLSLTSGDQQSGTDHVKLSGDMQSGTDRELFGD